MTEKRGHCFIKCSGCGDMKEALRPIHVWMTAKLKKAHTSQMDEMKEKGNDFRGDI